MLVVFLVVLFPILLMMFALVLERVEVAALSPPRTPGDAAGSRPAATVTSIVEARVEAGARAARAA